MGRRAVALVLTVGTALGALVTVGATPAGADSCTTVQIATSPEKLVLLTDLAKRFEDSDASNVNGKCVVVRVQKVSSGLGESLLAADWPKPKVNGPRPTIWSPSASTWGAVLNQRRADAGKSADMAPAAKSFMLTPLVIAMPKPMAQALGWPNTPIGFGDVLALSQDPNGWAGKGHPEWGPFRFGKTNPNFSTSGLAQTVAEYYAATGKTKDLTLEDLARPDVDAYARGVESAVVHYGDTTLTFLNNLYRADQRGTRSATRRPSPSKRSRCSTTTPATPTGSSIRARSPASPRPARGDLPEGGDALLRQPPHRPERAVGVQEPGGRRPCVRQLLDHRWQPAPRAEVRLPPWQPGGGRRRADRQGERRRSVPAPDHARGAQACRSLRRDRPVEPDPQEGAVLLVVDVSGSMGDEGDSRTGATKLDLAKKAALAALSQFQPDDDVGLRIFSTDISGSDPTDYKDLVPIGPMSANRPDLKSNIERLVPTQGTPLYTVAHDSYAKMLDEFDPTRINAVVLLTDGRNEDDNNTDLGGLLKYLRAQNEGEATKAVRIFPIAYGNDADEATLKRIAEATNAAEYSAVDPTTIVNVFNAVVSNF